MNINNMNMNSLNTIDLETVMDRDTNDVSLIRFVNRMSIPAGHSPIV